MATDYGGFASGLARSPLRQVMLSKLGNSGVPTEQEQKARKKFAGSVWVKAILNGIIVEDPDDPIVGYKINEKAVNLPKNKTIIKDLGKTVPGFLKYTKKVRRDLRKNPSKYAKGDFGGTTVLEDGNRVIKNGAPGAGIGEEGVEDEQTFTRFSEKDIQGLGKVMIRNLWVAKGGEEQFYWNQGKAIAGSLGVDMKDLENLIGEEWDEEEAEIERLQGNITSITKEIDKLAQDLEDLPPVEIRAKVGALLEQQETNTEALKEKVGEVVTKSGISIQTDPLGEVKELEKKKEFKGEIAKKLMAGAKPPDDVVTDLDSIDEQRAVFTEDGDVSSYLHNWSKDDLTPASLREQSHRHADVVARTEAFPEILGPGGTGLKGTKGTVRRVKRASLRIAKGQAKIDKLISDGKVGSPSIQRYKDQMAKDQLYIDEQMMNYENKKVEEYETTQTVKGGKRTVTRKRLVGEDKTNEDKGVPTDNSIAAAANKRGKLTEDKNALENELKGLNAKLIVAKHDLITPSDVIKSKTASLNEKRLVFEDLAYNWSLIGNPNATMLQRVAEIDAMTKMLILGKTPAQYDADLKNAIAANKDTLEHNVKMQQYFLNEFSDWDKETSDIATRTIQALYDPETGYGGFNEVVQNAFTANLFDLFSHWERQNIAREGDPFITRDEETTIRIENSIRQSEMALGELGGHAILRNLRETLEGARITEFDKWWKNKFGYSIKDMANVGGIIGQMNGVFDPDTDKLLYVTIGGIGEVYERDSEGKLKKDKNGELIVDPNKSQGFGTEYLMAHRLQSLFGQKFGWYEDYFRRKKAAIAARSQ